MRALPPFHLQAAALWLPGCDSMHVLGTACAGRALPMSLKRRVTPIGRKALEAAWAVLPEAASPRLILSSRHGEYARTMGLLESLSHSGEVSPADFSLSVHHALIGLLSIASANRAGHTAIAAGGDSFGYGLMEAAACVCEDGGPVVLMHFDEMLPEGYGLREESPMAMALLLAPPMADTRAISVEASPVPMAGQDHVAEAFARFLLSGDDECTAQGERMNWLWRRHG